MSNCPVDCSPLSHFPVSPVDCHSIDRVATCFTRCPSCMKKHPIPSPANDPGQPVNLTLQEPGPPLPSLPPYAERQMPPVVVTAVQRKLWGPSSSPGTST
ncbi:hypothetical protein HDV62DRAFT_341523 [Trichoderma sp. SZMC 28011]